MSNVAATTMQPVGRSRTTRDPLRRANGNTAQGRRTRDLYRGYMAALGSPADAATQALILAAAEQVVIAEFTRHAHLAGKAELDAVVRAENMSARALRRLGLNKPAPAPRRSLAEKMAAAQRAADAHTQADVSRGTETAAHADQSMGAAGTQSGGAISGTLLRASTEDWP
jgi:hypothetical protein